MIVSSYAFGFDEIIKQYGLTYEIVETNPGKSVKYYTKLPDGRYIIFKNVNTELKEELCQGFLHSNISQYNINHYKTIIKQDKKIS